MAVSELCVSVQKKAGNRVSDVGQRKASEKLFCLYSADQNWVCVRVRPVICRCKGFALSLLLNMLSSFLFSLHLSHLHLSRRLTFSYFFSSRLRRRCSSLAWLLLLRFGLTHTHTHTPDSAIHYSGQEIGPSTVCILEMKFLWKAQTRTPQIHTLTLCLLKTGVCCRLLVLTIESLIYRATISSLKIELVELSHSSRSFSLSLSLLPFVFLTVDVSRPCVLPTDKALMLITRHVACQMEKE